MGRGYYYCVSAGCKQKNKVVMSSDMISSLKSSSEHGTEARSTHASAPMMPMPVNNASITARNSAGGSPRPDLPSQKLVELKTQCASCHAELQSKFKMIIDRNTGAGEAKWKCKHCKSKNKTELEPIQVDKLAQTNVKIPAYKIIG